MKKPKRNNDIGGSEIPNPQFAGNKELLIKVIEGREGQGKIIPNCFSDPLLESGTCNPLLPLRSGEPCLCAFHKSCFAAKLLSYKIPAKEIINNGKNLTYEELLALGDVVFDQSPIEPTVSEAEETKTRQKLRAQVVSMNLSPARNPFRKNSLRFIILDILSRDWISLKDLRAAVIVLKPSTKCLDLVVGQVTNIATQEQNCYRIVETFGKYRAFRREDVC